MCRPPTPRRSLLVLMSICADSNYLYYSPNLKKIIKPVETYKRVQLKHYLNRPLMEEISKRRKRAIKEAAKASTIYKKSKN